MLFDRVNAKREAKQIIRRTEPSPVKITLIYLLLTSGISFLVHRFLSDPFSESVHYIMQGYDPIYVYSYVFGGAASVAAVFISLLLGFYSIIMTFGYKSYTLHLARGQEGSISDLFDGFGLVVKIIATDLLSTIFVLFWSMLFIVPGIIAGFAYSQATFCLLDDPDISPIEALRRSKQMMRGEKFNLFVLELSFIGWDLLANLGAALPAMAVSMVSPQTGAMVEELIFMAINLWLMPYQWIVFSRFYSDLQQRCYCENGPRVEF